MYTYIYIYIYIIHPVSITRFPLRRFSPGAGLLRYVFSLVADKIFQGLGPKRRESSNRDRVYVNRPWTDRTMFQDVGFQRNNRNPLTQLWGFGTSAAEAHAGATVYYNNTNNVQVYNNIYIYIYIHTHIFVHRYRDIVIY